jgi:hypothetical protein
MMNNSYETEAAKADANDTPPSPCICDSIIWDNLLDLPQVRHFRPFSAIAAGASRIIYYDARGLFWQCSEGNRQERVPAYLIRANDCVATQRRIFDSYPDDVLKILRM